MQKCVNVLNVVKWINGWKLRKTKTNIDQKNIEQVGYRVDDEKFK